MSAGVIPVVLDRGGVGDIVVNGSTGFLAPGPAEVASLTRHVFALDAAERQRLRRWGQGEGAGAAELPASRQGV